MKTFEYFHRLHSNTQPLLIGNVWDAHSARMFEQHGFKAVATSSAAFANTFGYEDGEQLPFDLLVQIAKRIAEVISIPLSVDIEGGFARDGKQIAKHIECLHDVGVVGINIEDSLPGKPRTMQPTEDFARVLTEIVNHLSKKNIGVFINVRTDGFLQGLTNALSETTSRIKVYAATGAHGIFVPCITNPDDIRQVVAATQLPINVMCMPQLPSFTKLQALGVKRISMGNFLHQHLTKAFVTTLKNIEKDQSFNSLFE
jgi:2-methylisocitrate lyase-like PEP mutase family enzyme